MAKKDILLKEGLTIFMLAVVVILVGVVFYLYGQQSNLVGGAKGGAGGAPECNDKIDNDGDGLKDLSDVGCSSRQDNDETNCGDAVCEGGETRATCLADCCVASAEVCDNVDNDCDGLIDEDLTIQCGTTDVGACQYGNQTCTAGVWETCIGVIEPVTEVCGDSIDNNCDGQRDEGCPTSCVPSTEVCDNVDNDCDGSTDEGYATCKSYWMCDYQCCQCCDGINNDGDSSIDSSDRGCNAVNDNTEQDACDDGIDNDSDGFTDYPNDPGCVSWGDKDEYNAPINQTNSTS